MAPRRRKHIGNFLKIARKRKRLKAEDLGRLCNVSRSRIYLWEQGRYVFPKNIPILAKALSVPVQALEAENVKKVRRVLF